MNYCQATQQWVFGSKQRITRREIVSHLIDYRATQNPALLNLAAMTCRNLEDRDFLHFAARMVLGCWRTAAKLYDLSAEFV